MKKRSKKRVQHEPFIDFYNIDEQDAHMYPVVYAPNHEGPPQQNSQILLAQDESHLKCDLCNEK